MCTRRNTLCLSAVILMIVGSAVIGQTTEELLAIRYAADQAVNAHDLDAQMSYWAEDCTYVFGPLSTPLRGKEAIRSFFESLYAGIPDFTTTDGTAWAAGNIVVVEHVASGTQLGEWMGIPPTGSPIVMPHIDIYEFEGTKVKWAASYGDMASVMMQLGVMPPPQMPELVPSFVIPDSEPTCLSPVEAAKQAQARFNAHDLPGHSRMQSPDDDIFIAAVGLPMSRDAWAAMQELYFAGFPDLQVFPTRFVDLGDGWVLSECTWAGTQSGPYFGIPATGRYSAVRGAMLYRYDAQGLEKAIHVYYDNLTVLNQIMPTEPQPVNPGVQGLLAHYDFENDARDVSGNDYNGVLAGDAHVANGVMVLDGTDDAVAVPRIGGAGAVFGQASYSMWVHPTVDPAPLDFSGGVSTNVWGAGAIHFKLRNGMVNVGISGLTGGDLQGKTVVAPNVWSHMALTVSDTAVSLYLNGHLEDSRTLAAPLTNLVLGDAAIGAWNQNGTNIQRELTGFMDDVRIYGRALSAVEVLWLAGYRQNDPEANKVVARRFFEEMWNQRRLDIVDELITADMVGHAPTGEFAGYKGEMQTISSNLAAFPDLQISVDDIIAEGNKVALRTSYAGTHTGPLGAMPPTGKPIRMTGNIIFRFEDGKVAEAWSFADMLGLMQQLGAASPPRPTPQDYAWSAPSEVTGDRGDPEANKALIQRFNDEAWNARNLDVLDELCIPQVVVHNPPTEFLYGHGVEGLKLAITGYTTAFPDLVATVEDMVAEGDMVSERWTGTGTHLGELMGIPASGKQVTWTGITTYRFADGKIVEMWWAWDTMGLMRQLTAQTISNDLVVDHITSPSLKGNLLGDPATREVIVYLPPSYQQGGRFPVVYLLHGYTGNARTFTSSAFTGLYWPPESDFPENGVYGLLNDLIARGQMREMIVVMPDGGNTYGGSFYVNSELSGNYEDYIINDLVSYIDSNYRTIANPNSRSIAGHSMGGYGAITLAMKHPDVFGAVAVHSGLLYFEVLKGLMPAVVAENPDGMVGPHPEMPFTCMSYAMAAAFSPDFGNPPLFVDLPFEHPSAQVIDTVWNKWLKYDPFTMLSTHGQNLASLRGIYLDCGAQDELGVTFQAEAFHQALDAAGILHHYELYEGTHFNRLFEKLAVSLTFLSDLMTGEDAPSAEQN